MKLSHRPRIPYNKEKKEKKVNEEKKKKKKSPKTGDCLGNVEKNLIVQTKEKNEEMAGGKVCWQQQLSNVFLRVQDWNSCDPGKYTRCDYKNQFQDWSYFVTFQ